jgi:hypothetical protein
LVSLFDATVLLLNGDGYGDTLAIGRKHPYGQRAIILCCERQAQRDENE